MQCAILKERPEYYRAFPYKPNAVWVCLCNVQMARSSRKQFICGCRTPFRYVIGVIPMGRQSSAFANSQALMRHGMNTLPKSGVSRQAGPDQRCLDFSWAGYEQEPGKERYRAA